MQWLWMRKFAVVCVFFVGGVVYPTYLQAAGFTPVWHLSLKVHAGTSAMTQQELAAVIAEINEIWRVQAGICFDTEVVQHDLPAASGFDLWFVPNLPEWNGYYFDDHEMVVRDAPDLSSCEQPARSSAARTAAHELGHALGLPHRQDSDDNLMRSKTRGWQLNEAEILSARLVARRIGRGSASLCPPPSF